MGSNRRPGPRARGRADRTRLAILEGASAAFRRRGFHGTRLDDVAAALDRTKASLYYYFRSKEQLLYFCQDRALDALLAAAARARGTPPEALAALCVEHVRIVCSEAAGGAAHVEDVHVLPEPWRGRIVRKRDRYEAAVRDLVARGQRRGDFAPGAPGLLARLVLGAVNWTARWYRPDGPLAPEAIGRELATRLVRGLR